jgi:hypothetical protein
MVIDLLNNINIFNTVFFDINLNFVNFISWVNLYYYNSFFHSIN